MKELSSDEGKKIRLRVIVDEGGCSGFQFRFSLENEEQMKNEDDIIIQQEDTSVVIDSASLNLISGSTVDFTKQLIRSSFQITDIPNSDFSCGCGSSFSLKL